MDLRWECARRTAALLRAECAEVLAAEGAAQRAAAYRILRAAQNLEMWAQLTGAGLPPRFKRVPLRKGILEKLFSPPGGGRGK